MRVSLCTERDCPSLSFEISVQGIVFEVRVRLQFSMRFLEYTILYSITCDILFVSLWGHERAQL